MIGLGGIALLYFIGKAYYSLAERHEKSKWGFAILGIASYYFGIFLFGGIVVGVFYEIIMSKSVEDVDETVLTLIAIPFGGLTCWGLYKILDRQWSKPKVFSVPEEILDANFINPPPEES